MDSQAQQVSPDNRHKLRSSLPTIGNTTGTRIIHNHHIAAVGSLSRSAFHRFDTIRDQVRTLVDKSSVNLH